MAEPSKYELVRGRGESEQTSENDLVIDERTKRVAALVSDFLKQSGDRDRGDEHFPEQTESACQGRR